MFNIHNIYDYLFELFPDFELLPSGRRYRAPLRMKNRTRQSFAPGVISLLITIALANVPIHPVRPAG
jgi:hypothetical protein